jgi:protein-tyrosine phosphatase
MISHASSLTEFPFGYPGNIFRSPMPFSPFDRLSQTWFEYQEHDVSVVVVLVEQQEYLVRAGRDLPAFYRGENLDVIHFPIPDFQVPGDLTAFKHIIELVDTHARAGKNIGVHCMAGIGRTGIFMACLAKHHLNLNGQEAIDWVRKFIPSALENWMQEKFVIDY